jgi:sortase A
MRRAVGIVLVVAGLLALADVAVTLAWQEPVTALRARADQHALAHELRALEPAAPAARAPAGRTAHRAPRRPSAAAVRAFARRRPDGHALGELRISRIGLHAIVVRGASADDLRRGPGLLDGTPLPGLHGTTAIAGHRTTYGAPFRHIDALRRGDPITLRMPYGTYRYAVEGTRIVDPADLSVLRRVHHDRLVLSSCEPLFSAAQRIVVFARLETVGQSAKALKPGVARGRYGVDEFKPA